MICKNIVFYHYYNNQKGIHGNLSATLIQENPHELRNGKVYYLNKYIVLGSLYVDPKLRNKGIGTILLNQLIEYSKKIILIKLFWMI